MRRFPALTVLIAAAANAAASPAFQPDDRFVEDTRAFLDRAHRLGFDGVALVSVDGRPIFAECFGMADRERAVPWSMGSVTTIGSITKQFTAAAVLKLQEDGLLSVEDPIAKHIPGVPEDKQGVTIHHILSMSSGVTDLPDLRDADPIEPDEFLRRVFDQPLLFPPGEGYHYSNANFSIAGMIIERLTGAPYERFIRERLFLPAGMYDTGYQLAAWGPGRVAQGYLLDDELWGNVPQRNFGPDGAHWGLRANGGVHSTPYDMLRWAHALMDGRVLLQQSLELLWRPHVLEGTDPDAHYAYGWAIMQGPGGAKVVTHNGGNGIFFADMAIVPDARTVIYLHTNTTPRFRAGWLLEAIGSRLIGGDPYPELPDTAPMPPEATAALAGQYTLTGGATLRADFADGRLSLQTDDPALTALLMGAASGDEPQAARTARVDNFIKSMLAGDYQPMFDAYEGRFPLDTLANGGARRLAADTERFGPVTGHATLATFPFRDGAATLVRIDHERRSVYRRYNWSPDGSLTGFVPMLASGAPYFYPIGNGVFVPWDREWAPDIRLRFATDEQGRATISLGDADSAPLATQLR